MTRTFVLPLAALVLAAAGCGDSGGSWKSKRPATVPVKGTLNYKSQPLSKAIVVFQPVAPKAPGASAITDEQGQFELQTFPPDPGAVPGAYVVTVIKTEEVKSTPVTGNEAGPAPPAKSLIPVRYGNPLQSDLKADVKSDGQNELVFNLVD